MKIISTTTMRKDISEIMDEVTYKDRVFGIGRRDVIEAVIIKYPEQLNKHLSEMTNVNAHSPSFNFLEDEPDLYSVDDLKKKYA